MQIPTTQEQSVEPTNKLKSGQLLMVVESFASAKGASL